MAQFPGQPGPRGALAIALGILWAVGALAVAARWIFRWMQIRRAVRASKGSEIAFDIPVRSSVSQLEPGVVGILRPVLLLPQGLDQHLTSEQMCAVLAHERCHLVWRDNLAGALHMLVETLFWFHPLIWWLGRRLVDERERACDEYVIAAGHTRESYAEGILRVCEQYLTLQLLCVSGVSGAKLRQRIEDIMKAQWTDKLSWTRKLLLSVAAAATFVAPMVVGVLTAPPVRAQAATGYGRPASWNLSIRIAPKHEGEPREAPGVRLSTGRMRDIIAEAYGVSEPQVVGQKWNNEIYYDVREEGLPRLTGAPTEQDFERRSAQIRGAMREVLAKNFGLITSSEQKQVNGYVLVTSAGGPKLEVWSQAVSLPPKKGTSVLVRVPVPEAARLLSGVLEKPVVDQTGLKGRINLSVDWGGRSPDPTVLSAALEPLGLRLEARTVTVEVINVLNLVQGAGR